MPAQVFSGASYRSAPDGTLVATGASSSAIGSIETPSPGGATGAGDRAEFNAAGAPTRCRTRGGSRARVRPEVRTLSRHAWPQSDARRQRNGARCRVRGTLSSDCLWAACPPPACPRSSGPPALANSLTTLFTPSVATAGYERVTLSFLGRRSYRLGCFLAVAERWCRGGYHSRWVCDIWPSAASRTMGSGSSERASPTAGFGAPRSCDARAGVRAAGRRQEGRLEGRS